MTCNYTTLFDSYYLSRGIALYQSLRARCQNFHLFIFAFDEKSEFILKSLNLSHVTVISLKELEDERLLAVKGSRGKGEYCWTCTPSTVLYCIERFNLDHCTYIDADLYFFSNPNLLIQELGKDSVLITEHHYTKKYDQSAKSGKYCVQFMTFRNTNDGMTVLRWWRDRCIEWCFDKFEDGKFGDQKYLDDWPSRFKGVHVLEHLGGGVAPWNVQQYEIINKSEQFQIVERATGREYDIIFYHFHALKFLKGQKVDLGAYDLSSDAKMLYYHYLLQIEAANKLLLTYNFEPIVQNYQTKKVVPHFLHKVARMILGVYHIHDISKLKIHGKTN